MKFNFVFFCSQWPTNLLAKIYSSNELWKNGANTPDFSVEFQELWKISGLDMENLELMVGEHVENYLLLVEVRMPPNNLLLHRDNIEINNIYEKYPVNLSIFTSKFYFIMFNFS